MKRLLRVGGASTSLISSMVLALTYTTEFRIDLLRMEPFDPMIHPATSELQRLVAALTFTRHNILDRSPLLQDCTPSVAGQRTARALRRGDNGSLRDTQLLCRAHLETAARAASGKKDGKKDV